MKTWMYFLFGLAILILFSFLYGGEKVVVRHGPVMNGVNIEAPSKPYDSSAFITIKNTHSNWVALIPYAFTSIESADVFFDNERQWWGERSEGIIASVKMAHDQGLQVMIKPHLWVKKQGWAGEFELNNESDWQQWEAGYRKYVLNFAKIAEDQNVALLCIGTECRKVVTKRPEFWEKLIEEVRSIYKGQVTYAANWDNYDHVGFWDKLDYIGIDAYFPLGDQKTPSTDELIKAWEKEKNALKDLSGDFGKPIIFTEYGYQSIDYTATGHWEINEDSLEINYEGQRNGYLALYQSFWKEEWFYGGFLWKWHMHEEMFENMPQHKFTPQNKPAMQVVLQQFKQDQESN